MKVMTTQAGTNERLTTKTIFRPKFEMLEAIISLAPPNLCFKYFGNGTNQRHKRSTKFSGQNSKKGAGKMDLLKSAFCFLRNSISCPKFAAVDKWFRDILSVSKYIMFLIELKNISSMIFTKNLSITKFQKVYSE